MQRTVVAPFPARPQILANAWLARRWYYTSKSHRSYSVRQISPGDRRLLAEFALGLARSGGERERAAARALSDLLFEHVIGDASEALGFAALDTTAAGDRVIGVCACTTPNGGGASFHVAVAHAYREEQIGRNLLTTLLRHVRRIGVARLAGETDWSNRPMQMLAMSMGFIVEPVARDRGLRSLVLTLK